MNIPSIVSIVLQLGYPVHVLGEPGIGKTAYGQELVRKLEYHLVTMIASNHEPSDITGLPAAVDGYAEFLPIPMIREIKEMNVQGIPTVMFLDEISTAPPAMQAACLRLLHERIAGNTRLPDSVLFFLASNPVGTSAGTFLLSAAMANRMFHFEWPTDHEAWARGMIEGFDKAKIIKLPTDWKTHRTEARTLVASYVGINNHLLKQPKETTLQAGPWPSPRTWEMSSDFVAAVHSLNLPKEENRETLMVGLAAVIGEGESLEFVNWYDNRDLKKPREYLDNAKTITLPERSDQIFATLNNIVSYCINKEKLSRADWKAAWVIMGRTAEDHADFAAIPAQMLVRARPKGFKVPPDIAKFLPALQEAGLVETR